MLSSLRRGFELRDYGVLTATDAESARVLFARECPAVVIVDLRIGDRLGLDLIVDWKRHRPDHLAVLLSGYLSVGAAVDAARAGADHVLCKPVSCGELIARIEGNVRHAEAAQTPSLARAEWEHMMRVLHDCDGNISEAARRLGLHRQNLQRRLRKDAPPQ